jgi:hypothetical protein
MTQEIEEPDDVDKTGEELNELRSREYVDDRDLEQLTPLKRVTWQQMRARRIGPPWYKIGRRCVYKLVEVREWIERHPDHGGTPRSTRRV